MKPCRLQACVAAASAAKYIATASTRKPITSLRFACSCPSATGGRLVRGWCAAAGTSCTDWFGGSLAVRECCNCMGVTRAFRKKLGPSSLKLKAASAMMSSPTAQLLLTTAKAINTSSSRTSWSCMLFKWREPQEGLRQARRIMLWAIQARRKPRPRADIIRTQAILCDELHPNLEMRALGPLK